MFTNANATHAQTFDRGVGGTMLVTVSMQVTLQLR